MKNLATNRAELAEYGFTLIENVFSSKEVQGILAVIECVDSSKPTFRRSADLFAIRQFLKEVPQVLPLLFTERMQSVITQLFGEGYFLVKSIYFDKPGASNWFVSYHQDLTISVDKKVDVKGFGPWTVKQNQFAVQPRVNVLENIFTLRIHLDDTGVENGALRVVPGSHRKGIYRPETIEWNREREVTCSIPKGGVMIMRPLLLHASSRTTNHQQRRVIHMEFSSRELPAPLKWSERINQNSLLHE